MYDAETQLIEYFNSEYKYVKYGVKIIFAIDLDEALAGGLWPLSVNGISNPWIEIIKNPKKQ